MEIIVNKKTGKQDVIFEICDTDYNNVRNRISFDNVNHYPIIKSHIEYITAPKEDKHFISTNIKELDISISGGLTTGLYVIGANPGVGKTSLMLHLMLNLALNKQYSLLFNLEMSKLQVSSKLLSNISYRLNLENEKFNSFSISELLQKSFTDNLGKVDEKIKEIYQYYLDNIEPYLNVVTYSKYNLCNYVEAVETALKNYKEYHNVCPVIVIDYLQLLKLKNDVELDEVPQATIDKRIVMDKVIDKLKEISNHYKATIIIISSLSRSSYTKIDSDDTDIQYSLAAFKETGGIEYTADFLALLTKGESEFDFSTGEQETININILKNRYGKAGIKIPLVFNSSYAYFKNITNEE